MSETRPWLEIREPGQPDRREILEVAVVRIGRGRGCEIRLRDSSVAKVHAELRDDGGGYRVRIAGADQDVSINGARLTGPLLRPGDVIELGAVEVTYRSGATPTPSGSEMISAATEELGGDSMTRLARFFEFSRKLGGGFSLEEVLSDVVDLAIELTGAERGVLVELDKGEASGIRVARDKKGRALPTDGLTISETLVRQAVAAREPLVVPDVGQDTELSTTASIMSLELRSAVILPLTRGGVAEQPSAEERSVFGVLYLDSRKLHGRLDALELGILERLAQDTSAAIENAWLLQEAEQKRRIEQEVAMAREVQATLMPREFVASPAFEVVGTCEPCLDLGGDFVDQFDLGDGRNAVVVADVCGKGIAASLLGAALQGALASEVGRDEPLGQLVAHLNRVHARMAPTGRFVTMAMLVLEPDGTVQFVNAGHCPPLHLRADGVTPLKLNGMALGLIDDAEFGVAKVRLEAGESIVLYTDGVVECEGPGAALYGSERLEGLLGGMHGESARGVLEAIRRDTDEFRGDAAVTDDFSVIVARRLGDPA